MQSLGLNIFQLIFHLYIKRFFSIYIGHLLAVFCILFVVVTPLLCLDIEGKNKFSLMSLEFYQNLGVNHSQSAAFALVILLIHGLKVLLDHKTSFWEVEFG